MFPAKIVEFTIFATKKIKKSANTVLEFGNNNASCLFQRKMGTRRKPKETLPLTMECYSDELSPAQKEAYATATKVIETFQFNKLYISGFCYCATFLTYFLFFSINISCFIIFALLLLLTKYIL